MLKLGYRGFEARPEARCLAMLFGADQRQRPRITQRRSTMPGRRCRRAISTIW
jgi:hypothetical protein